MIKEDFLNYVFHFVDSSTYTDIEKQTIKQLAKQQYTEDKKKTTFDESDFNLDTLQNFHDNATQDCRNLRKLLKLPITKKLRFMQCQKDSFISFDVSNYQIIAWYTPSMTASLLITLNNGENVRILSDYFSHMQKESFESDIQNQLLENCN
ncbi:MAG: hypothetical protein ACI4HI_04565 [Lachnospiraceae bacterium]